MNRSVVKIGEDLFLASVEYTTPTPVPFVERTVKNLSISRDDVKLFRNAEHAAYLAALLPDAVVETVVL